MKTKRILIICIIVVLSIGIVISVHLFEEKKQTEIKARQLNMFEKNWPSLIRGLIKFSLEDFINLLGQPEHIQECWKYKPTIIYTTLYYDTFCVNLIHLDQSDKCRFANVMITDSEQKIWRGNIGIGSTKSEVEAAFRHVPEDPSNNNAYFDTVWAVEFEYSQNDVVTEITLYPPW